MIDGAADYGKDVPTSTFSKERDMAAKGETERAFTLDDLVRSVAGQLSSLRKDPPKDPVLALSGCDIELAVKASVSGKGGVKFYIFSAEAGASVDHSSRILLRFGVTGDPVVMVADGGRALAHAKTASGKTKGR